MWNTRIITARILVWLAAISVPVQSLPASCACSDIATCCPETGHQRHCCCSATKIRQGRCCCCRARNRDDARQNAAGERSCCQGHRQTPAPKCTCGVNCQCGKANPTKHVPPPVENENSTEKLAKTASSLACVTVVSLVPARGRRNEEMSATHTFGALNRCVSLCRFTL